MIIKKFTAKDSRSAMIQIRNEFGPDAILLSSKSVGDHFEMIAAPNYDDRDIERELELQRIAQEKKVLEEEARKQSTLQQQVLQQQALKLQEQMGREQELARLHAQDQQSLKLLQDEMAEMRSLIEAQLKLDAAADLQSQEAYSQKNIDRYLAQIGLSKPLRESVCRRLQGINEVDAGPSKIKAKTMQILANAVRELDVESFPDRGIAAFIGAKDSGKTTALIKLAQKHRKRQGVDSIGLILFGQKANRKKSQDDLLLKYSSSLGITCLKAETPRQLLSATRSLADKQLVLIDCEGLDVPTAAMKKALLALSAKHKKLITFLTVAADRERSQQENLISAYSEISTGLIVTKIEKARYLGGLVELMIRKKLPLGYIAETRKTDANISQGNSEKLIRMALNLGDLPNNLDQQADAEAQNSQIQSTQAQKFQAQSQGSKSLNKMINRNIQKAQSSGFWGIAS